MDRRTKVVNKKHGIAFDVYIGRPSIFGNPFVIGKDGTREEVIQKYRQLLHYKLKTDAKFKAKVDALKGKTLGCFCAPAPCHGDVLVEYLEHTSAYFDSIRTPTPPPQKIQQKANVDRGVNTESRTKRVDVSLSGRSLSEGFRAQSPSEDDPSGVNEHGLRSAATWSIPKYRTERTPEAVAVSGVSCPARAGVRSSGPGIRNNEGGR